MEKKIEFGFCVLKIHCSYVCPYGSNQYLIDREIDWKRSRLRKKWRGYGFE